MCARCCTFCCNSVILLTLIINCYVAGPAHGQRTKARRHYGMPPDHGVLASEQRKRAKGFCFGEPYM